MKGEAVSASSSRVAVRIDQGAGIREEVGFFGPRREKLAGALSAPLADPVAAMVICPPICVDFLRNYRREVVLARELASRGIAVQRFQYRGTGNSDGRSADMTFTTMVDDADAAARHVGEACGVDQVVVMGTRFGALVAAALRQLEASPLVLVDPVLDPVRFFREGFRARMASEVKERHAAPLTAKQLVAELTEIGSVDVLGHTIDRALYETWTGRLLLDELGDAARRLLLVQLGGDALRTDYGEAVAGLGGRGFAVDVRIAGDHLAWWFVNDEDGAPGSLVAVVADWIADQVASTVGEAAS